MSVVEAVGEPMEPGGISDGRALAAQDCQLLAGAPPVAVEPTAVADTAAREGRAGLVSGSMARDSTASSSPCSRRGCQATNNSLSTQCASPASGGSQLGGVLVVVQDHAP